MKNGKSKTVNRRWWWVYVLLGAGLILEGLFLLSFFLWKFLFVVFGAFFILAGRQLRKSSPESPVKIQRPEPSVAESAVKDEYDGPVTPGGDPFNSSDYDVVKTIRTKVVGVTFKNEDGSSRQEIISDCFEGQPIQIHYFDYKGSPAYSVIDEYGNQLGNVPAPTAQVIFDQPDDLLLLGEITEITGGEEGQNYGCNIVVKFYRKK